MADVGSLEYFRELYGSFNSKNVDNVLASLSPDVRWANGWEGGFVHGRDEVAAYWRRQWETLDPHVEPLGVDQEADVYVVDVRQVVRDRAGQVLVTGTTKHLYRFAGGLVSNMEIRDGSDA